MKRVWTLFTVSLFFTAQTVYAVPPDAQANQLHHSAVPNAPCPGKDFASFLEKFSNDENIQRAFTKYPLTEYQVDAAAEPEPKQFKRILQCKQIQFPVMPLRQERSKVPLNIEVLKLTSNKAYIRLFKEDTDYQISYFFRKKGCWKLVKIDNESL